MTTTLVFPSIPASRSSRSRPTDEQLSKWAKMALTAVFDEAEVPLDDWKRLDEVQTWTRDLQAVECLSHSSGGYWSHAQAVVYNDIERIVVLFVCNGEVPEAVRLREAAERLGWA